MQLEVGIMAAAKSALAPMAKSKMKARSAAKGLTTEELEKLVANLSAILKSEKSREKVKTDAAKQARIAKIRALMDESGLKPSDIQSAVKGRRKTSKAKSKSKSKPKPKAAPKYRLVIKGQEYLWSGRGRPPTVFKTHFDSGKSRESCAI
jgi:DNA-binding protein H-NS